MSYVSQGSRANKKVLHRIGFDVDSEGFRKLSAIPYGFRTKMLRELIQAVLKQAEKDGDEAFYKVAAGDFTLRVGK